MIIILDFSIEKDCDRNEYVKRELKNKTCSPTSRELETMADYILFGKDDNGFNEVDKKNIEIKTKYSSYAKRKNESIEELTSNPAFDERSFRPVARTIYKNPKPQLNKNLPELQPLLEEITKWEHVYNVAIGKEKDENLKPKTQTEIYKLKHFIIDLKKQQYTISEALNERICTFTTKDYVQKNDFDIRMNVRPLGLKMGDSLRFDNPREDNNSNFELNEMDGSFNFENPLHIYQLLEFYSLILEESIDNPYGNEKYLLETLDFYISKTPLEESRKKIIELKKHKVSNQEIRKELEHLYGLTYNENYISTIYTKEICKKIAETVTLHKDYWLQRKNPLAWKKCSCCGQWKLKDAREFTRKKSSVDGFTSRCKVCDKQRRKSGGR